MNKNLDRYNGMPSIVLDHRPFFSIIIACYNSRETLENLLDSILDQEMNDDIEVILSDDCSTESYDDIVDDYRDILSIRQIKTDYNFAPGNTREKGVSIAEGEWISIADHDDEYIPGSLKKVKEQILANNEQFYAVGNFIERDYYTGNIIREMKRCMGWNHAKFYNLDNLWKHFDIHFTKDLLTHEDICISSQINCVMNFLNRVPLFIDEFCYVWNARTTSVSRSIYMKDGKEHHFLEMFFEDYLKSTAKVYFDQYRKGNITQDYAIDSVLEVLGYAYFYTQGFIFHHPDDYIKENVEICRKFLVGIKKVFGYNNEMIYNWMASNDAYHFCRIKETADLGSGPYIPSQTIRDWLNSLHEDIQPKLTMKDVMHKI